MYRLRRRVACCVIHAVCGQRAECTDGVFRHRLLHARSAGAGALHLIANPHRRTRLVFGTGQTVWLLATCTQGRVHPARQWVSDPPTTLPHSAAARSRSSFHTFHRSGSERISSPIAKCGTFTSTCGRYLCGATPGRLQIAAKLERFAAVWPPRSLPTNNVTDGSTRDQLIGDKGPACSPRCCRRSVMQIACRVGAVQGGASDSEAETGGTLSFRDEISGCRMRKLANVFMGPEIPLNGRDLSTPPPNARRRR